MMRIRNTSFPRMSLRTRLAALTGALIFLAGLAILSIDLLYWDFWRAVWTRAQYDQQTSLIDSSQYLHAVPIASNENHDSENRYQVETLASAQKEWAAALLQMAEQTSSNIVVINSKGSILFEAYKATPGADDTMLTNSMSMAKTLVALLVGVAIDQGVIESVDQPISELLREFENDKRGKITIRNLLQMESGLASQDAGRPLTNLQAMYFGDSPHARALSVPAVAPPGTVFSYNSVNTQILLVILERHLGGEFEELLSRYIWRPLDLDPGFGWRASPDGDAKGFCCVFGTARTWASIGRIVLNSLDSNPTSPLIVSKDWVQQMISPSREGSQYGYQVRLGIMANEGVPFANLDGTPQQYVYIFPTLGIAAVRVGDENSKYSGLEFISKVIEFEAESARL